MPKETKQQKRERALHVIAALDHAMPEAKIELDHTTPFELLVATILSAQCTDRRVNMVTPALFKRFPTPGHYARVTPADVEPFLKSLGLFRNKAKSLVKLGAELDTLHNGVVPTSRSELAKLSGVGNKTAGVVTMHIGGDRAFPVDTHVMRLAFRLGFTPETKPDRVEHDLQKLLPEEKWFQAHQLLVWHGRRVCHAISPECHRCTVATQCPKKGVKLPKKKPAASRRS